MIHYSSNYNQHLSECIDLGSRPPPPINCIIEEPYPQGTTSSFSLKLIKKIPPESQVGFLNKIL